MGLHNGSKSENLVLPLTESGKLLRVYCPHWGGEPGKVSMVYSYAKYSNQGGSHSPDPEEPLMQHHWKVRIKRGS